VWRWLVIRSRAIPLLLVALFAGRAAGQDAPAITVKTLPTSLAGEWLFRIGHDPAYSSPFREKRNWQRVRVPGPWDKSGFPGYRGHAWYRLPLFFTSDLPRQDLGLELGLVGDVDEVFLNGRRIGATGGFPPHFDRAKLASRFYFIPREAIRFGEFNELAIHVYSDFRPGGLLGPSPRVDSYEAILGRQFLQHIVAYSLATFLLALALLQIPLFLTAHEATEHLVFAAFLTSVSLLVIAPARWGMAMVLGHGGAFRVLLASLLVAEALMAVPLFRLARMREPRWFGLVQTLLLLAAAFSLVGREGADIFVMLYTAEVALAAVVGMCTYLAVIMQRKNRPWSRTLTVTLVFLAMLIVVDLLTDHAVLPRTLLSATGLIGPFGLVPFGIALSLALIHHWVERRWGEPIDSRSGLMNRDHFADRLGLEMERSRRTGHALATALIRINLSESSPDLDRDRERALAIMRRSLRQIDTLARYDQETYAVVLVDTDERAAMAIIERLRVSVSEGTPGAGQARIRTAAGVAQYRAARHSYCPDLVLEAEAALYAALSEGGNCTATAP
jgi:diguanylate cyclase (GGDEF)-like protein